ncbi:FERM domain-containing protein 5-like isoform X2 [Mercenaria mercenaria]|uniref:FERM domain-containing protein 5-like isoform X2 n=1 Tax=Mercenaria mercenaria TaxID=6596 RepID=UPI00234EB85C|nr:FERM domain-containing protein 5-like isoform X2 [Mercenaria mercenaria]
MTLFRKSRSKGDLQQEFHTTVRFLDDSEPIQLPFTKETLGQFVLDKVCDTLNLVEKDYFGLRFVDAEKQRHWLDPTKTVYKQLKGVSPCVLCFRVKFYPEDPMKLHEEITRYYLFLQLRRDLHHGRLLCSPQDANLLAAYIIQSEVGDYDPQDHPPGYVAEFKMLPGQNIQQEQQIHDLHKTLVGQVPAEAEANFLKKAASLDTYGVDPHKVKDQKGNQMYLGVTHQGIMTFHGSRRTQIYKWSQIKKLAFEGKTFIAHVNMNEDKEQSHSKKKHQPIGYKCLTVAACKYLWRCAVEQQFFFTLQSSFHTPKVRSGGSLFSRGSKFRFSGRCQNEAYLASEDIKRKEPDFQRTCSLPNFARKSDSRIHMRNSANLSISEDKGGKGYKADTFPRMSTATSASAEPRSEKRNKRPDSLEKDKKEEKPRMAPRASEENIEIELIEPVEIKEKYEIRRKMSAEKKPKLKEIARQSSKEVIQYTEVEQRQTVLEGERVVSQATFETKPMTTTIQKVTTVRDEHENAVDVPQSTAEVVPSPKVTSPVSATEDTIVAEEMTQVKSSNVEAWRPDTFKQNGGIPIIVTTEVGDTSRDDSSLPYNPDNTVYDQDDEDDKIAKSLEEQVIELEKEFQQMQEQNHVENVAEGSVKPTTQSNLETAPKDTKTVETKKGHCSCGKIFAFTFFSLFLTLTVSACVVMFSDIDHPVMNEARAHLTFLEPTRDFILDKYHELVNKL